MEYSFLSGDETITLNHLNDRQMIYLRSGSFVQRSADLKAWKMEKDIYYNRFFGENGQMVFGKNLVEKDLDNAFYQSVKHNKKTLEVNRPAAIAEVFKMRNGELTAMLYEYIVGFQEGKSQIGLNYLKQMDKWVEAGSAERIWEWKGRQIFTVKSQPLKLPEFFNGLKEIQNDKDVVEFAHPNFVGRLILAATAPDAEYVNQWALNPKTGGAARTNPLTIDIESAWEVILKNNVALDPVPVMVLDQGIFSHGDLQFASLSSTTSSLTHGLRVSGVLGALQNSNGMAGISPNPGSGRTTAFDLQGQNFPAQYDTIATQQMAVDQATWVRDFLGSVANANPRPKVLNLSFNFLNYPDTFILDSVLTDLSKEMVICVAMGNYQPGGQFGVENAPGYPATKSSKVIGVGAVDINGRRATLPNYGWASKYNPLSSRWLVAPGVGITSTAPGGTIDHTFKGTSAATAFVSGVAALLFAANRVPAKTPKEIRKILLDTALYNNLVSTPPLSLATEFGSGCVQAGRALKSLLGLPL